VSYRQSPLFASGGFVDTMEVASTWSRLLPMYEAVRGALSPHVFVMAHFSHAYPDGASIYFTFAGSSKNDDEALRVYDRAWSDALAAVVGAGGTLSHHHGVGRSKAPAMRSEQGVAVDVVRELKRELDPRGILNPGALLPVEEGTIHAS
jgi:alkyldihydroxyacetonephosphate synthase